MTPADDCVFFICWGPLDRISEDEKRRQNTEPICRTEFFVTTMWKETAPELRRVGLFCPTHRQLSGELLIARRYAGEQAI